MNASRSPVPAALPNERVVQLQRLARAVYATAAAVLAGWFLMQAVPGILAAQNGPPWDATDHWAVRNFVQHQDPFTPDNVIARPPTSAFWFLPLASIGYGEIKPYISAFMLLLLFLQLVMASIELELPVPLATATLAFCAIGDTWWLQYHLGVGQTSILISFCYTLGWVLLRRDQQIAGGVALGLATTMKPFAGLMVLFLALSRRWRAFAAAAVAWLLIAIYMTHGFGLHSWIGFLQSKRAFTDQWLGNANNASLSSVVLHLFHPVCQGGRVPPTRVATMISTVLSLALIAGAWMVTRKSARDARTVDLPFALFAVLSVFCNPVVWEHYNVFLLLPLGIAAAAVWRGWLSGLSWWWIVPAAAVVVGLCWLLSVDTRNALAAALNDPKHHVRAHLWDISQWIRWPLTMAVLGALNWCFERFCPSGALDLKVDSWSRTRIT